MDTCVFSAVSLSSSASSPWQSLVSSSFSFPITRDFTVGTQSNVKDFGMISWICRKKERSVRTVRNRFLLNKSHKDVPVCLGEEELVTLVAVFIFVFQKHVIDTLGIDRRGTMF